jgi:hypothetical protein
MKNLVLSCLVVSCSMSAQDVDVIKWDVATPHAGLTIAAQSATFDFIAAGPASEVSQIKGSPFSAEGVTEFRQILVDGTVIQRSNSSKFARDGQGRTRTEQSVMGLGSILPPSEMPRLVTIFDPASMQTIMLDEKRKTATITKGGGASISSRRPAQFGTAQAGATFESRVEVLREVISENRVETASPGERVMVTGGNITYVNSDRGGKREDLGIQIIEGVKATGTRTTTTIPVGAIGNSREILVVRESWYSPDLQMVVMNRTSDPQSGETSYRLTNIRRAEPDASLFVAPADYTVQEHDAGVRIRMIQK